MPEISVNVDELLKWGRFIETIPNKTKAAASRALNAYGDNVARSFVRHLSDGTGMDPDAIRRGTIIRRATPRHLVWELDATKVVLDTEKTAWERPWESRDDSDFEKDTLVKIIAHEDSCDVCAEIAADSPYTMEQVRTMAAKWANYVPAQSVQGERTNLVHPNCRCALQTWSAVRKLPVTFSKAGMPPELLSASQLARHVLEELAVSIRALP